MNERSVDVLVIGSGAGGGTVAAELAPLAASGVRILVVEQGARIEDHEFTGRELDMAPALYEDGGGFLTADGTMTLALGRAYGGSTVVYTGVSLVAPERVIQRWDIPGLTWEDVARRSARFMEDNGAHMLPAEAINENNTLFVRGCEGAGFHAEQFPVNVRGCRGSSLCNLGCPNGAKQGTNRVQLPAAERAGVEVVTRAEVLRLGERMAFVRVSERGSGEKGRASEWPAGEYTIHAPVIVVAGGSIGTTALLLRSGFGKQLPQLGSGFTCHPAHILVAEHAAPIVNDVGHPKSWFVDRAEHDGFVLETCMYFPFTTAKNLSGFGAGHSRFMRAFPRLQMILNLACDKRTPQNRITVDRNGRAVVHYRFTSEVIDSLVRGTRAAARIFFAAGAERVYAPSADPPLIERHEREAVDHRISARHFRTGTISVSAAHMMGGCALGRNAADSVTNSWGMAHGIPWLRIADSSLFPDSVEINPYLTVMALASRSAEAVRRDLPALRASRTHGV